MTLATSTTALSHSNTDQRGYAVVRAAFLASAKLQCTASEDVMITGINGMQVTFKKGEKFTLLRAESLGDDNLFYVVPRVAVARPASLAASIKARDEAARLAVPLNGNRPFRILR